MIREFLYPADGDFSSLESETSDTVYHVTHDFDLSTERNVNNRIVDAADRISEEGGAVAILEPDVFDIFYRVLSISKNDLRIEPVQEVLCTAVTGLAKLGEMIEEALKTQQMDNDDLLRNALKMYVFVITWASNSGEVLLEYMEQNAANGDDGHERGQKRKRDTKKAEKASVSKKTYENWLDALLRSTGVLRAVLLMKDIHRLWAAREDGIEEEFCNAITRSMYKLLESPRNTKEEGMRMAIANLLGVMADKYNRVIEISTALYNLVSKFEHLPVPAATMLAVLMDEYEKAGNVTIEIIREIARLDVDENNDTKGSKNSAELLKKLSELCPTALYQNISVLILQLDSENPTMRTAVLHVITQIVANVLKSKDGEPLKDSEIKARDDFIEIMIERLHDKNSNVRRNMLALWQDMCTQEAIPLRARNDVFDAVVGRLMDRTKPVRKQALATAATFLRSNPYGDTLKLSVLEEALARETQGYEEMKSAVKKREAEAGQTLPGKGNKNNGSDAPPVDDDSDAETDAGKETSGDSDDLPIDEITIALHRETEAMAAKRRAVEYFTGAVEFTRQIHSVVPFVCKLLSSTTDSDVLEAIDFFVSCHSFKIEAVVSPAPGEPDGIRQMLTVVFSPNDEEGKKRSKVLEAYTKFYLKPSGEQFEDRNRQMFTVVKNLIELTFNASTAEIACLKPIVVSFYKSEDGSFTPEALQTLWNVFELKVPNTSAQHARGALIVLSMLAGEMVDQVQERLNEIMVHCLGSRGREDPLLAKYGCIMLQALRAKSTSSAPTEHLRIQWTAPVFSALLEYVAYVPEQIRHTCTPAQALWYSAALECINTVYALADHPDRVAEEMTRRLYDGLCAAIAPPAADSAADEGVAEDQGDQEPQPGDAPDLAQLGARSTVILARLLFVLGHISFKQLVHMEAVESELKRRRHAKKAPSEAGAAKDGEDNIEDDLGVGDAATDDAETDRVAYVVEHEIVQGGNFLSTFQPLIQRVVRTKCNDPVLGAPAVMALCKYMAVSQQYCADNLQLLFTVLRKGELAGVRSNIIISVGDLVQRYPNLLADWMPQVYARVRDDNDDHVRKTAVMVLTHLILNDMIKVKGQISNLALCLVDQNPRIKELAKLFFSEMAKKDKAIYNLIPDIIGRMSSEEESVEPEVFQEVMKLLLGHVTKSNQADKQNAATLKQCEALIEKLCLRFNTTRSVRQWRDIAFCLSQLHFTEKGFRKLLEKEIVDAYKGKLYDEKVYGFFKEIMKKLSSFMKAEIKQEAEDLKVRWEDWHRKGAEDDEASRAAARALGKETGDEESAPAADAEGPATQDESEDAAVDIAAMSIEEKAADDAPEEQPSGRKAKSGRGARDRGAAKKALPVVEDSSDDEDGEPQPDDDMDIDEIESTENADPNNVPVVRPVARKLIRGRINRRSSAASEHLE